MTKLSKELYQVYFEVPTSSGFDKVQRAIYDRIEEAMEDYINKLSAFKHDMDKEENEGLVLEDLNAEDDYDRAILEAIVGTGDDYPNLEGDTEENEIKEKIKNYNKKRNIA